MATPKKLDNGKWQIQVFSHVENGKRKYVRFYGATKAEAQRKASEFQENRTMDSNPQDITIEKMVDNYIQSRSNVCSPKTVREYIHYKQYYENIKNVKLGSLTSLMLQNFVNDLAATHKSKTVKNVYSLLSSSIRLYSDRRFQITLPATDIFEPNVPVDKEIRLLMSYASPMMKKAIILGAQGMRRGEIAALKYGDILRDMNSIYIHADIVQNIDNEWVYKPRTKNTHMPARTLAVPKAVIDALGTGEDDEYILGVYPNSITSGFCRLRDSLGLQCRFHDLRHYSASILHELKLPDAYIMDRNGYSSDVVMKKVYTHALPDKKNKYVAIANKYFEENIMQQEMQQRKSKSHKLG